MPLYKCFFHQLSVQLEAESPTEAIDRARSMFKGARWNDIRVAPVPDTPQSKKMGPKVDDHPSIGEPCPACKVPFKAGDYTTLVSLGPGDDAEAQWRARAGRIYNAVAVEVHYSCATGFAPQ